MVTKEELLKLIPTHSRDLQLGDLFTHPNHSRHLLKTSNTYCYANNTRFKLVIDPSYTYITDIWSPYGEEEMSDLQRRDPE